MQSQSNFIHDLQAVLDDYENKEIIFENQFIQKDVIFVNQPVYNMSSKKLAGLKRIADLQKYYQCNPVLFLWDFFGVALFDAQAWIMQQAWNTENVLVVATRSFGKSLLISCYTMAKNMLFGNSWTYLCSNTGAQAQQTFTTLERLANDSIDEMIGSTGYIFKQELEVPNAVGDGFSHSADGWRYKLYNGAFTQTLNSNISAKRGMRGSVIFDETGWTSAEMLQVYAAFAATNKNFKTGADKFGNSISGVRLKQYPKSLPYQKFYFSSASSTDTEFYRIYRQFAKKMYAGDPRYFVAFLDCTVAFKPTMHGELLPPLITPDTVDAAMKTNPEKARREYYCQFTQDVGDQAIIKRGAITRNEETRIPLLTNDTGDKQFVICYDPARRFDNSVVLIGEIYGEKDDKKCRIVNCVSMVDYSKKYKTPKTIPGQIDVLRHLIVEYAGGDELYTNVSVHMDAGSGGQASSIADLLSESWTDDKGVVHKGIVDPDYDPELAGEHKNAAKILKMYEPLKYKPLMYEATIQMIDENKISFTAEYDNKGYLTLMETAKEIEDAVKQDIIEECKQDGFAGSDLDLEVSKRLKKTKSQKAKIYKLSRDEEDALINIDICKEQIVSMVRIKRDTRDSFELAPEKRSTVKHDDHAYTLAMMGYVLKENRKKNNRDAQKSSISNGNLVSKLLGASKKSGYRKNFLSH